MGDARAGRDRGGGFAALVQRLGGASYFSDLAHARLDTSGLGIFKLASLGVRFALLLWLATTPNPSRRRLILGCAVVLLLTTGQRSAVFATLIPVLIVYHNRVRRLPAAHAWRWSRWAPWCSPCR